MIWQTTQLDCMVAEEIFGWKWYAFDGGHYAGVMDGNKGTPVRHGGGYIRARVREFMSPKQAKDSECSPCTEADMQLPIAYNYYPPRIPHVSGHRNEIAKMEAVLKNRKLHKRYVEILCEIISCDPAKNAWKLIYADCEQKCIAALAAVGSKYVSWSEVQSE